MEFLKKITVKTHCSYKWTVKYPINKVKYYILKLYNLIKYNNNIAYDVIQAVHWPNV